MKLKVMQPTGTAVIVLSNRRRRPICPVFSHWPAELLVTSEARSPSLQSHAACVVTSWHSVYPSYSCSTTDESKNGNRNDVDAKWVYGVGFRMKKVGASCHFSSLFTLQLCFLTNLPGSSNPEASSAPRGEALLRPGG